jgi:hypothetical protein
MSHLEFIMVFILVLMAGAFGIAAAIVRRRGETKTTVKVKEVCNERLHPSQPSTDKGQPPNFRLQRVVKTISV